VVDYKGGTPARLLLSKEKEMDTHAITELQLFLQNDAEIYTSNLLPAIKNATSENVDVQLFLSYSPLGESAIEYNVEDSSLSFFVVVSDESDYIYLTPFVIGIVVVFIVLYFIFTLIVWRRRS